MDIDDMIIKLQDGRSEAGVAASVEDRLSTGTYGVRAPLPADFPPEFIRPPSPEHVFEDGPHACLLDDDDGRLSFADVDLPLPCETPNCDDVIPTAWLEARQKLIAKTKYFVSEKDVEEDDPFAEYTISSKECVAELSDDYRRE